MPVRGRCSASRQENASCILRSANDLPYRSHGAGNRTLMPFFHHDGFDLHFESWRDVRAATPVLLVHGFASSLAVNWVNPLWVKVLADAGRPVIAFDHRGHGGSTTSENARDYTPQAMASDAFALMDHLGVEQAHFLGYSMGARVSAFAALNAPHRVASLGMGGLGMALIDGAGFWGPVRDALAADDPASITDTFGLMFRKFADQTGSNRRALAACIEGSRVNLARLDAARIVQPALIAAGTRDTLSGDIHELASIMPNAIALDIEGRDHMPAVGDKAFKAGYLAFLAALS
jgi:pimeloyl-ACP methyl ester carboxylesterase